MKLIELTAKEQLISLKKDDYLLIEWRYDPRSGKPWNEITMSNIYGINSLNEVIVRIKDNLYFGIDRFLEGTSCAKQVFQIVKEEEQG